MCQRIERLCRERRRACSIIVFAVILISFFVLYWFIFKNIMAVGVVEEKRAYAAAVSAAAIFVSASAAIIAVTFTLLQMRQNRDAHRQEDAHELIRDWNDAYTSHIMPVAALFNEYLSEYGQRKDAQCPRCRRGKRCRNAGDCDQVQIPRDEVDALFSASSTHPSKLDEKAFKYYEAAYALEYIFNYFSLIADAYDRGTADEHTIKDAVSMNMVRWYDIFQEYIKRVNDERYPKGRVGPWGAFAELAKKWEEELN